MTFSDATRLPLWTLSRSSPGGERWAPVLNVALAVQDLFVIGGPGSPGAIHYAVCLFRDSAVKGNRGVFYLQRWRLILSLHG